MAVDTARVQSLIDEWGLEGADKETVAKILLANERAATQFVGQRERHDDYTKKTQGLTTQQKELERKANEQITLYAQQLAEADKKVKKILADFEQESISRTTAEARLRGVKERYNLSDEDIPDVKAPTKRDPNPSDGAGIDIDAKLKEFESNFLKRLMPDLIALPRVSAILNEIDARHMELTGKRLTLNERNELMDMAQDPKNVDDEGRPVNLMTAWQTKYDIKKIEKDREFEGRLKEERTKWDDEQKRKRSEDAMRGVRTDADAQSYKQHSPVLREYKTHDEAANRSFNNRREGDKPPEKKQSISDDNTRQGGPKLSGAERAAQRFMERRAAGIPLGKEEPAGAKP